MEALFLRLQEGQRFCLLHEPSGPPRGVLLYLHPLAEEMNLSRRMAALQARALCAAGYVVLQIDLYGCGESEGEFGRATWSLWLEDGMAAADWLQGRYPHPVTLWGLRSGCLLAADLACHRSGPQHLVFWQPLLTGDDQVRQLLRLQRAAALVAGSSEPAENLVPGSSVQAADIGGYVFSAALLEALAGESLALPAVTGRIDCVEVSAIGNEMSAGLQTCCTAWSAADWDVRTAMVRGQPFWQIPEIEDNHDLVTATMSLLGAG